MVAKLLMRHIQAHLPQIIRPNQTRFITKRNILDNIFLERDAMESEQKLVLLLLDFEKAFNKINWDFLFIVFHVLGFSEWWVLWVSTLYKSTSSIQINGESGLPFFLSRLVWQGCPLSLYLFILATNVFKYVLYNLWTMGCKVSDYPIVGFFEINHLPTILYFIWKVQLRIWFCITIGEKFN